ncbi:hypothetical protein [Embleya hyalina]|uniref:Uncharacterized protein n=1 Tax=Embleya hyalina TaxID=516124 RepID=A0A401YT53_9ACTN|nr:hypothetical protein [Embleya hyalina]GCD97752.1 hypothetical protein EHYA_05448 [Embleya hyalina]
MVATAETGKADLEAGSQETPGSDETYFVMFVPQGTGQDATLSFYDTNGAEVGDERATMAIDGSK